MLQDIYEVDTVKNYPVGMRYARDDRVFRYCRSGYTDPLASMWAWGNANLISIAGVALPLEALAGQKDVTITDGAAAEDDYQDGWLCYFRVDAATRNQMYRIRHNDATAGGRVVLHLYDNIYNTMPAGGAIDVHKNIYSNVIHLGEQYAPGIRGYRTAVCIPLICAPAGSYFWGQTWGPCFGAWASIEPGATDYTRELDFSPFDGALILHSQVVGYGLNISAQHAGVLLPHTDSVAPKGSNMYMLQISS